MEYQVDETETVHFTISYLYFPNRLLFQLGWIKGLPGLRSGGKSDSGHHHPFSWRTALQPCDWPLQVIGFPTVLDRITQGWSNRALWPLCRCAGLWRETYGCWPMFTSLGVVDQFSSKRFLSNFGFLLRGSTRTQFTFKLEDPRTFLPPNARFQGKQGPKPRRQCRAQRLFDVQINFCRPVFSCIYIYT